MRQSVAAGFSDQTSSLLNLKWLVGVLVFSNIVLGLVSFYLLHLVDRRYSDLVGRAVPELNELREGESDIIASQRLMGTALFNSLESNRADAVAHARAALAVEKTFMGRLLAGPELSDQRTARTALLTAAEAYRRSAADVLRLFIAGQNAEAGRVRDEIFLPAFDHYLAEIGKACDLIQAEALRTSDIYSEKTGTLSKLMLGLASWPVLVFSMLLLLVVTLVIAMMVAFRGKDLADAP